MGSLCFIFDFLVSSQTEMFRIKLMIRSQLDVKAVRRGMATNQRWQNQNLLYQYLHKACREITPFIVTPGPEQTLCILDFGWKMVSHSWGGASQHCQFDLAPTVEQLQVWELKSCRAAQGLRETIHFSKREKKIPVVCYVHSKNWTKLLKTSSKDVLWGKKNA